MAKSNAEMDLSVTVTRSSVGEAFASTFNLRFPPVNCTRLSWESTASSQLLLFVPDKHHSPFQQPVSQPLIQPATGARARAASLHPPKQTRQASNLSAHNIRCGRRYKLRPSSASSLCSSAAARVAPATAAAAHQEAHGHSGTRSFRARTWSDKANLRGKKTSPKLKAYGTFLHQQAPNSAALHSDGWVAIHQRRTTNSPEHARQTGVEKRRMPTLACSAGSVKDRPHRELVRQSA